MADEPCDGWTPNHALCTAWATFTPEIQAYADRVAARVIWSATGRQFGLCPVTVRPCWAPQEPLYQAFPVGYYGEGFWSLQGAPGGVVVFATGWCACASACACSPPQMPLPGPVASVTSVVIDGVTLAPAAYRVDLETYLVRQDGLSWPSTQNLGAVLGAVNTWAVTYMQGTAVPSTLQDAAGLYACEVAKARTGGSCQLPNRVRSVTRAGVEINYVNEDDFLAKGRTGYDAVDSIIFSYNPYGLTERPRVVSPDMPRYR
jgi:hypothetical protein